MQITNFNFLYKFSRFLLIGLSLLVLFVTSQQIGSVNNNVLAYSPGECVNGKTYMGSDGSGNPIWAGFCTSGGNTGGQAPGGQAPGGQAPGPACTPNEVVGTTQHCKAGTNSLCTYNIQHRADCSTYEGGDYACQNIPGQCGFNLPPAVTPPPAPPAVSCPQPAAPGTQQLCNGQWGYDVCDIAERYSDGSPKRYSCHYSQNSNCAGTIQCAAPQQTPTPVTPTSSSTCPTQQGQTGTQLYCNGTVLGYDECNPDQYYSDGSVKHYSCRSSVNRTSCIGEVSCPAQVTSCNQNTNQESSCVGQSYCSYNVIRDCNNNVISRNGPYNCQNMVGQCGTAQGTTAPPISITNSNPSTSTSTSTSTSSNTNNITISTPAQTFGNIGVGTAVRTQPLTYAIKQLPSTGLPAVAWSALAFIPAGLRIRKFRKMNKDLENDPTYLWENRQYKRNGHTL